MPSTKVCLVLPCLSSLRTPCLIRHSETIAAFNQSANESLPLPAPSLMPILGNYCRFGFSHWVLVFQSPISSPGRLCDFSLWPGYSHTGLQKNQTLLKQSMHACLPCSYQCSDFCLCWDLSLMLLQFHRGAQLLSSPVLPPGEPINI